MAKLTWDAVGTHLFETGVDQGVLYLADSTGAYPEGVAWNGLTGITQSPSGADETKLWADNIKYVSLRAAEEFGGTIEAYTYPDEFAECDGSASVVAGLRAGQQSLLQRLGRFCGLCPAEPWLCDHRRLLCRWPG